MTTFLKVVNSEGKVAYSESAQAWSVIKLKKELFNEFPELKEKRSKFSYQLKYFRDSEEFKNMLKALEQNKKEAIPLLLFLYKDR